MIKFRAYDKETEEFIYSDKRYDEAWFEFDGTLKAFAIHGTSFPPDYLEPPEPKCEEIEEPQQYIGQNDKAGVEIYEGDLFKILGKYSVIEWGIKGDSPAFILKEIKTDYEWPLMTNLKNGNLEVIGNIHKNPELI